MARRAIALAVTGGVLILVALAVTIWGVPALPLAVPSALTGLLLLGTVLGIIGAWRWSTILRRQVAGARARELHLRRRVDALEESLAARVKGLEGQVVGEREGREATEADLAAVIAASDRARRLTAAAAEVSQGRLDELEAAAHAFERGARAQDVWAHEIESRLWSQREAVAALEKKTASDRRRDHERLAALERVAYDLALRSGAGPSAVFSSPQARMLASRFARDSDYLRLKPLIEDFEVLDALEGKRLLAAYRAYRRLGYLPVQAQVGQQIALSSRDEAAEDRATAAAAEAEFFRDPEAAAPVLAPEESACDVDGPVIHLVGKALPETQSGYTLRTHYTVRALHRRAVPAIVVCQAGAPGGSADETVEHVIDDVRYVMLQGSPRHETTYQLWIADNVRRLAAVVRTERPSVLHAHSDFLNALIASVVGRALGLPVVYESRGFWEESWLSRTLDAHGLSGAEDDVFAAYGMPEAYTWRQRAEIIGRERSDANLTLGRTMRDHIRRLARPGTLENDAITLVPNGVDLDAFGAVDRDEKLAASLGIEPGDVVIGCVSSIVEYEGIDTLLHAFAELSRSRSAGTSRRRLLVVGDGDRLESLRQLASELGMPEVIFTGRVPHAEVLGHYGLIDIFVIPRKPTRVSRLVTPLKPYEALATGRAVVLSDVEALQEVAEDSGGAAELFPAGDHHALAELLARLLADPQRRAEMAARGAQWVRRERTWDANAEVYDQVYRRLRPRSPRP